MSSHLRNKKGFSLVELLVVMAIMAVLIGIAAYGIIIVQRNLRDTRRRTVVNDLRVAMTDIQASTLEYPSAIQVSGTNIQFVDSGGTVIAGNDYAVQGFETVTLLANCSAAIAKEASTTTVSVCYDASTPQLGVNIEGAAIGYKIDL